MLSIIVSSCDKHHLSAFMQSVAETVQAEYETIVIENHNARYSLTEAYNLGASKAKYPYLLFVHEDIAFKTVAWGKILASYLESLGNVGIIGIAGADYKPFVPSGWGFQLTRAHSYNLIQGHKYRNQGANLTKVNAESVKKVVCLDGVFLAVRKDVFEKIKFDEAVKGFHGYDLDFSLSVSERYQNYFVPDILIEHFSEGKINDQWIINSLNIFNKWKAKLPFSANGNHQIDFEAELAAYADYVDIIFESSLTAARKISILTKVTYYAFQKTRSLKFGYAFLYCVRKKLAMKKTNQNHLNSNVV